MGKESEMMWWEEQVLLKAENFWNRWATTKSSSSLQSPQLQRVWGTKQFPHILHL
jgi:hypothetical protein